MSLILGYKLLPDLKKCGYGLKLPILCIIYESTNMKIGHNSWKVLLELS